MFISGADNTSFKKLKNTLANQFTLELNEYMKNIDTAANMLINNKLPQCKRWNKKSMRKHLLKLNKACDNDEKVQNCWFIANALSF